MNKLPPLTAPTLILSSSSWSCSPSPLSTHGRRSRNITEFWNTEFFHVSTWRAVSVHQPEGLRGLLSSAPCRVSGGEAKRLAHQSSLSHHQVYRDQIQLIRLSLWKNAETWARNGEKARGEKYWKGSFPRASLAESHSWASGPVCCHLLLILRATERAKEMRKR